MQTELKVTLLTHTPSPDKVVATAAKLCYSSSDIDGLMEKLTPEKTDSFVQMLASFGHESPTEHVSFTFAIEGVSRSLLAQITRHRLASYSVKSQRYVTEGQFEFILPPAIEEIPQAKAIYLKTMEIEQEAYNSLTLLLLDKHMKDLIAEGKEEAQAKGIAEKKAIEDARYVLPNACETKMIVTMNTRSLMNFFHHRCCERAQWEIRALAIEMLKEVKKVAPSLFGKAGPSCLKGNCPEGKMSCGKMAEKRQYFGELCQ